MDSTSFNYSVIIPHKNIPMLLKRCLDSIPRRKDTQIIVVDDNSDPSIVDFSKFPGLNEPRTEVYFTKEGKGAGYARNVGLKKAKGNWILFADADDYFNNSLDNLMDKYLLSSSDLIIFRTNSTDCDTLIPIDDRGKVYNDLLVKSLEKKSVSDYVRFFINPVWGKFFSRRFIEKHQILFDEVYTANDVMFSTKSGYYAQEILIDSEIMYCATVRSGSLDYQYTINHIKSRFDVALDKYRFLKSRGKAKYRINVLYLINSSRKVDKKWINNFLIPSIKTIDIKHNIQDLFQLIFRKTQFIKK
ncbi:MAG: glycosyltransferase family 2 protein [Tissierellia bacterium]|nr:glycosyltransferase family 2 protein [Tissierellia bacterium]MDD4781042.1 glycosyltransferase family 2 protein [Tissierellia bacterium]